MTDGIEVIDIGESDSNNSPTATDETPEVPDEESASENDAVVEENDVGEDVTGSVDTDGASPETAPETNAEEETGPEIEDDDADDGVDDAETPAAPVEEDSEDPAVAMEDDADGGGDTTAPADSEEENTETAKEVPESRMDFDAAIQAEYLQEFISMLQAVVSEAVLEFNQNGISTTSIDKSNVALAEPELTRSDFESLEAASFKEGFNIDRMDDVLSNFEKRDIIRLQFDEDNKLHISDGKLSFSVSGIKPEAIMDSDPDIPDLELSGSARIDYDALERAVSATEMVSDYIEFVAEEDQLAIRGEGDTDDVSLEVKDEDDGLLEAPGGSASALFSLDYLKSIQKALPSDEPVIIEVGDDFPLKLHSAFADGNADVTFMVAPRIQED